MNHHYFCRNVTYGAYHGETIPACIGEKRRRFIPSLDEINQDHKTGINYHACEILVPQLQNQQDDSCLNSSYRSIYLARLQSGFVSLRRAEGPTRQVQCCQPLLPLFLSLRGRRIWLGYRTGNLDRLGDGHERDVQ
jgi:hypothetical protein